MKPETETGVRWPQTKKHQDCWEAPEASLKLNVKIVASGSTTSWQTEGKRGSDRFPLLGSKITADGDSSHEIRRQLLLGRIAMTNLDSMLKSKEINLPTKVSIVEVMVFLAVMYECESWAVKKAESWRIDAFECAAGEDP